MQQSKLLMDMHDLRQKLLKDPYRPQYHFLPPEGSWNDINGTFYWNGRYHLHYLQKIENQNDQEHYRHFFSCWGHISSRDLLHWRYHPVAVMEGPCTGYDRGYVASGSSMIDRDGIPTIMAEVRGRGIFMFQSHDADLDRWERLTSEPVVYDQDERYPECWTKVMDTDVWREEDMYYSLIGQKSFAKGYERGDCVSLFSSKDMKEWKYEHPFYQSREEWTEDIEDCACPNFFPLGDRHMLVMHTHLPYTKVQYYIGRYEDHVFHPEQHGQFSQPASLMGGPRLLLDGKGRRLFWGWLRDPRPASECGWNSIMTLPWVVYPGSENELKVRPAEELEQLRYAPMQAEDIEVCSGEAALDGMQSNCMEMRMTVRPGNCGRWGIKLCCSPDGEEETVITYDRAAQQFVVDFSRSSLDPQLRKYLVYHDGSKTDFPWGKNAQPPENPYVSDQKVAYAEKEAMELRIFVDRSVIEVFVNNDICLTQRIYPTREDSLGIRLFAQNGSARFQNIEKWEMDATNAW